MSIKSHIDSRFEQKYVKQSDVVKKVNKLLGIHFDDSRRMKYTRPDQIKNIIHESIVEVLKHIEDKGHGGGNWRRIIIQTKEKFENN